MSAITSMGADFISHVEMALINDATQLLSDRGAAYQKNLVEKVGMFFLTML